MDSTIPTQHKPKRHGSDGRFKKGQTGNPGGRPKKFYAMARYIREQLGNGQELADFAIEVFRNETHEYKHADRWAAMQWLADRGFGKCVTTNVEIQADSDTLGEFDRDIGKMDPDLLADLDEQVGALIRNISAASE